MGTPASIGTTIPTAAIAAPTLASQVAAIEANSGGAITTVQTDIGNYVVNVSSSGITGSNNISTDTSASGGCQNIAYFFGTSTRGEPVPNLPYPYPQGSDSISWLQAQFAKYGVQAEINTHGIPPVSADLHGVQPKLGGWGTQEFPSAWDPQINLYSAYGNHFGMQPTGAVKTAIDRWVGKRAPGAQYVNLYICKTPNTSKLQVLSWNFNFQMQLSVVWADLPCATSQSGGCGTSNATLPTQSQGYTPPDTHCPAGTFMAGQLVPPPGMGYDCNGQPQQGPGPSQFDAPDLTDPYLCVQRSDHCNWPVLIK